MVNSSEQETAQIGLSVRDGIKRPTLEPAIQFGAWPQLGAKRARGSGEITIMRSGSVVVVGAGIGGLACAATLAARGLDVTVLEAASGPGGRMRETFPGGVPVDSGPTVLTLVSVFEELFAQTGERLAEHLTLDPLEVLARHAWSADETLDLFADHARSVEAIRAFAGDREAAGFERFCQDARRLYGGLYRPFMRAQRPALFQFAAHLGPLRAFQLRAGQPFASLWSALGRYFKDPRLHQLFGRYATYVGSSPFASPAVLMLIAEVELHGVFAVRGGMARLARALEDLCIRRGVRFEYGQRVCQIHLEDKRVVAVECAEGQRFAATEVVYNGNPGVLCEGALGADLRAATPVPEAARASMSALTYAWRANTRDFPLAYHTVFFSSNYADEFSQLFGARKLPAEPTVYVCAQDRATSFTGTQPERLFAIINAPALARDTHPTAPHGKDDSALLDSQTAAREGAMALMQRCGLKMDILDERRTGPAEFSALFPGNGGAIYGQACHGWNAPFLRPSARSAIRGLYLTGGSVHPGPGVPMVAISGQLAAEALLFDRTR